MVKSQLCEEPVGWRAQFKIELLTLSRSSDHPTRLEFRSSFVFVWFWFAICSVALFVSFASFALSTPSTVHCLPRLPGWRCLFALLVWGIVTLWPCVFWLCGLWPVALPLRGLVALWFSGLVALWPCSFVALCPFGRVALSAL